MSLQLQIEIKLNEYTKDKLIPYDEINVRIYLKFLKLLVMYVEKLYGNNGELGRYTPVVEKANHLVKKFKSLKKMDSRTSLYDYIIKHLLEIIRLNKEPINTFFVAFFNMQVVR